MSAIDPLPPELGELVRAERAARLPASAAHAIVRAKLAATVASAPLGAGAAAAVGIVGKLGIVVLAVAVGAGTVAVVGHRSAASVAVVEHRAAPPVAAVGAPVAPPHAAEVPPTVPPAISPSPPAKRVVIASRTAVAVPIDVPAPPEPAPAQAEILRQAWDAISAGDAVGALQLADKDRRLHPKDALDEERAALEIVALARLHRSDEARASAESFFAAYPNSVHRALIERVLEAP